jgi:hypothetical protein
MRKIGKWSFLIVLLRMLTPRLKIARFNKFEVSYPIGYANSNPITNQISENEYEIIVHLKKI